MIERENRKAREREREREMKKERERNKRVRWAYTTIFLNAAIQGFPTGGDT
jgi:hypothetical protein